MEQKLWLFLSMVLFGLSLVATAGAQTTYDDPQGRFAIDLPKGWQLAPQTDDKVFVFQGEGKTVIIECVLGMNDPAELLKKAETTLRSAGWGFDSSGVMEMTLNGLPARWCVYKGALSGASLAALCGGVVMEENGLYFLSIIPAQDMAKWKDKLEKSFQSIRGQGQKVTGVESVNAVSVSAPAPSNPTPWASDLVSLTLPPGWSEKPKPRGSEKEAKGLFMYDPLPGTLLMVVCYKGMGMTMSKALEAGIKTMTIPVPGLKPVEAQEMKLGKRKIYFAVYKGMGAAAGTEVEIASVITVTKADKCYVNLIVIGIGSNLAELKNQALEIVKTVK